MQVQEISEVQDISEIETVEDSDTSVINGTNFAQMRDMPPRTIQDFLAEGVNPAAPTEARPGTEDKVRTLSARYEAGLPLWNMEDCLDHGPRSEPRIDLIALAPVAEDDDPDDDVEQAVEA